MPQSGITLAVIVKDEAAWLRDLLARHAPLCTAAVVVDTGSRDGSAREAEKAGARVLSFDWCGDFSAARNAGLAVVETHWVLVLDCDERIAARDFGRLADLARGRPRCHLLPQWNYALDPVGPAWEPVPDAYVACAGGAPGFVPAWSARLFPSHPDFRYEGCVHENLTWQGGALPATVQGEVPVHHYGHLPEYSIQKDRNERNFKLLLARLKVEPHNTACLIEVAGHLLQRQQGDLARRMLEGVVLRFPGGPETHRARLLLGRVLESQGHPGPARTQFDLALRERPDWRPCWVEAARAAISQGDRERTRSLLREGRRLFPHDPHLKRLEAKVFNEFGRYMVSGAEA